MSPAPPPAAGDLLDGRYRLLRELASGGMGTVWEAEHVGLARHVALKLLHATIVDLPGTVARFEREARATSRLDHPNIVRVTDVGCTPEGQRYLVLELLVGHALSDVLLESGPLSVERAIALTEQLLSGLAAAHAQGLVHRDLKPDNLFLVRASDGTEQLKILDFGIAALRGSDATKLTQDGAVMGTPAYMSPEQALGRPDLDARSDLHAVGVILYEMLAGTPPYVGENYHQVLHAIIAGEPRPLVELRPGLPPLLYTTIARAMAGEPAERYADAAAFRAALRGEGEAAFRLPAKLEVTDLRRASTPIASAAPEPPRPRTPTQPAVFEVSTDPALELDRPAPVAAPPVEARPAGGRGFAIVLLVVALAIAGTVVASRMGAPHDANIELTEVPPGATLALDGVPIEGHRLVMPISSRRRVITIVVPNQIPRRVGFVPDRDLQVSLARAGEKP